jgi:hypothetical protein
MSIRKAFLMLAIVVIAANTSTPSRGNGDMEFVRADMACHNLTSSILARSKRFPIFSTWLKLCDEHPDHSQCQSTDRLIKDNGFASPLSCATGPSKPRPASPPSDQSSEGGHGWACADVAMIVMQAEENSHPELPDLVQRCNADPYRKTCMDSEMRIELGAHKAVLSCDGGQ